MANYRRPYPVTARCAYCEQEFACPQRVQGGGRHSKYCSRKCGHKAWLAGNPEKRKAAILRYDQRPENKEQKQRRSRLQTLRKYGWTEQQYQQQLKRQQNRCYGCMEPLLTEKKQPCIDHDHKTGRVRGLLCQRCNWTLGHALDSPEILRRLMAYLDYKREKICVYLAGALKNPRIPVIGNTLRDDGFDVMDEWFTPGQFADENWQAYEKLRGRSYTEALRGRAATNIFLFDKSYLEHSDLFVLVAPAGKSAMLELGYAKGLGKKTVLFLDGEDPERYDVMPRLVDEVTSTLDDLRRLLKTYASV